MSTRRQNRCLVFLLALLLPQACPSFAAIVDWDNGAFLNSEWTDPQNWLGDVLPNSDDTARIFGPAAAVNGTFPPPVSKVQLGALGQDGDLLLIGDANPAILEAFTSVTVNQQSGLNLNPGNPSNPGNAQLITGSLIQNGRVTVNTNGEITTFQQVVQNRNDSLTLLQGGQVDSPLFRLIDGELQGDGELTGDLTVGGIFGSPKVSPGTGVGKLEVGGDLELRFDAELVIDIDTQPASRVLHDQIEVAGHATLDGKLTLNLEGAGEISLDNQLEILVADELDPDSFFDVIDIFTTDGQAVVVTFIPDGPGSLVSVNVNTTQEPGDMFNDGIIDEKDAELFAWAIRDIETYNEMFRTGYHAPCDSVSGMCGAAPETLADIDGDFELTFADIPAFLDIVDQGDGNPLAVWNTIATVLSPSPVPEPTTFALGVFGLTLSMRLRSRR